MLQQAQQIDEVIVATDNDEIEKVVSSYNLPKVSVYRRLDENATDTSSTESVMLEYIKAKDLSAECLFILVQCTSPFTQSIEIDNALAQYSAQNLDSLLSCVESKRFFWNDEGKAINYDPSQRPRRQDFEGMYMENGAFYISRVKNILRNKNRLSGKIGVYKMPEYTGLELDEPDDWIIAEAIMSQKVIKDTNQNG